MESAQSEKHTCLQCGTGSDQRVLLQCEFRGKQLWVCVSCLPMLIHGAH